MSKLFKMNLQLFAEGDLPEGDVNAPDDVDTPEDSDDDMESVFDEEEGDPEVDSEDDTEDDEEDAPDVEANEDTSEETANFDKKQQQMVNKIIEKRLERQEGKLLKDLSAVAGTSIELSEVQNASKLWGLLKTNEDLSRAVDEVIDQYLSTGKAIPPTLKPVQSKENELALKEAVLDLKIADRVFQKHSDKILKWADDNGIDVTSPKELKLAYMAWKGSQANVVEATKKVVEQKKQAVKMDVKKRATVQSGRSSASKAPVDYTKLSDSDVLRHTGVKLFTDD